MVSSKSGPILLSAVSGNDFYSFTDFPGLWITFLPTMSPSWRAVALTHVVFGGYVYSLIRTIPEITAALLVYAFSGTDASVTPSAGCALTTFLTDNLTQ